MTEWPSSISISSLLILSALCMWVFYRSRRAIKSYPPGPPGHALFGNLWEMPSENAMIRFRDWCKTYGTSYLGPIIHLWVPGQVIIILDKFQAAVDLLEKRSLIYSDRPTLHMLRDVIGWDWSVVMLNYGERFKKHRKAFYQGLNSDMKHYSELQENVTAPFHMRTSNLKFAHTSIGISTTTSQTPGRSLKFHGPLWGRSLLSRVTYGYDPDLSNDRYVWLAKELEHVIADVARPGAYLVDTVPLLKYIPSWFPGAGFKRRAKVWSAMVTELLETPFEYVIEQMQKGSAPPSYVASMLKDKQDTLSPEAKNVIKETAAVVHIGKIYAAVQSLLLVLVLYPEVQKKAHEEIDTMIGSERLPGLNDRDQLPYIHNMVSEMLRWTRSVPLGVAHELKQDDHYNGMFFPAKSLVIANIWQVNDERRRSV
ncbi:hypothetical protein D9757_006613 [Collybiopsis confluens]|uniref:Cytochrome P450 n=1 Tax=Collybiopsis confluens TaxID=2823264 RepID=A0A8H5HQH6_9AGAR|nr:hypothetical protein D9757_006613 [Collybiopsis confluens]